MASGGAHQLGPVTALRAGTAALVVLLMSSHAELWYYMARGGPKPLHYVVAVTVIGALVALLGAREPSPALRSPVVAWAGLYLAVTLAWYAFGPQYGGRAQALVEQSVVDRFRSMGFIVALMVILADPLARRTGQLAMAFTTAAVSVGLVLESVGVVTFADNLVRIAGRASGFFGNANQAGQAMAFGASLGVLALPRPLRLPLILVAAVGVAATFSRGAMLGLLVVVILLAWNREIRFWEPLLAVAVVAGILAVSSGALLRVLDAAGTLNPDTLGRLEFTADDSGRRAVLRASWQLFLDSPLAGNGVGVEKIRSPMASHNTYVSLAADHGVVGLVLLPLLALAIGWRNRRALPFVGVLLVTGFFTHNLLEEENSMVAIALAAATGFHLAGDLPDEDEDGRLDARG